MPLVLTLAEFETFNIGHRRFRLVRQNNGPHPAIEELGGSTHGLEQNAFTDLGGGVTVREGLSKGNHAIKLVLDAPEALRIWRGRYDPRDRLGFGLLAPVPEQHLLSGEAICAEEGRVAFGSSDFLFFRRLDEELQGEPCRVLIYASWSEAPLPGPPRATWAGLYLRSVVARTDGSAPGGSPRPPSTLLTIKPERWAIYWEITDLATLGSADHVPIGSLRGRAAAKRFAPSFRPERPMMIEAL